MTPDWRGWASSMFRKRVAHDELTERYVHRDFAAAGRESDFADAMRTNRRAEALVMTPTDWRADRMPERAIVEVKFDGIHLGYDQHNAGFTREGVPFDCASHLVPGLDAVDRALGGQHVLFGEYVHPDGFAATLADFKRGRGMGGVMLFDAVPFDAWEGRAQSAPTLERRFLLGRAIEAAAAPGVLLSRGELFVGEQRDHIELAAGAMWELGREGIVVKDADAPYVRGQSPFWQRIKRKVTVDVPIVRANWREKGGRAWLRSLTVRTAAGVECDVGVGFSEAQRTDLLGWRAGRIVELTHLGLTAAGKLRSPSFNRCRPDKES